jgi:nitric oxide reductase NorD protein
MSFDEYIYGKVSGYLKKRKENRKEIASRQVYLEELKSKLSLIARAVTGNAIDVFAAEREGGYKNNNFFLPEKVHLFPSKKLNEEYYLYRTIFLSIQKNLGLNFPPNSESISLGVAQKKAFENKDLVLKTMQEEFPWAVEKHKQFHKILSESTPQNQPTDYTWLYGKWMIDTIETETDTKLQNITDKAKLLQQQKIETIIKAKPSEELKNLTVDKKQQEDHVVQNYFEKIETAEEFEGSTWRDFDGSDELEEHLDALDEMNLKQTIRVDDPIHSVYQAEFTENTNVMESAELEGKGTFYYYDEWNYKKQAYKTDYCKVYPKTHFKSDVAYYNTCIKENQSTLTSLRKMLTSVNNKYRLQRRQPNGDEFDFDALIDLYVDIHNRRTPSENIYLSKQKKEKDLSILLLLDISLSSDSYAANNRVIDVEKQVSILFGEILNEFNVDFSIDAFFSKTRNHTSYFTLKHFDEDWNTAKFKIGTPQPQGYTRIGSALRHSGSLMAQRDTKNKWIILLSDGKPNDFDRYEGRYGINDIKQALRELNQQKINTYALAIEAQAKYYLPQMFGADHYEILTTPVELLQSLAKLYEKIKFKS